MKELGGVRGRLGNGIWPEARAGDGEKRYLEGKNPFSIGDFVFFSPAAPNGNNSTFDVDTCM